MAKKSKTLDVLTPRSTPEWGANSPYAFCDVFGGDAVLFADRQLGWYADDPLLKSQHPNKSQHYGGTVRYFGSE